MSQISNLKRRIIFGYAALAVIAAVVILVLTSGADFRPQEVFADTKPTENLIYTESPSPEPSYTTSEVLESPAQESFQPEITVTEASVEPESPSPTPQSSPTKEEPSVAPTPSVTKMPAPSAASPSPKPSPQPSYGNEIYLTSSYINPDGMTIAERFTLPEGFERIECEQGSFEEYVRNLPLIPYGEAAMEVDGDTNKRIVSKDTPKIAVLDRPVYFYTEQCADSCIRTWADYLFSQGRYNEICFQLANGFECSFDKYCEGYVCVYQGGTPPFKWRKLDETPELNYALLTKYLRFVYDYAYTGTMTSYLPKVSIENMKIGDVLVKNKTSTSKYGHAVMIADMAVNKTTGEIIYLMIQGSTPAVDNHVIPNPASEFGSPWFKLQKGNIVTSAEWFFSSDHLKRFEPYTK